jgi:hypothetical protein
MTPRLRRRTSRRRWEPVHNIPVTNLLERLFVEERRRLKIISNGFGEKPVPKLMFGALVRAAERWRGLRFTEFELSSSGRTSMPSTRPSSLDQTGGAGNAFPAHPRLDPAIVFAGQV